MAEETVVLTHGEKYSLVATLVLIPFLAVLGAVSAHYQWWMLLAACMGGLGGMAHEIAQSGGRILFFQSNKDGVYLGSIAGVVLGAIAGILVVKGDITGDVLSISTFQLTFDTFVAGLAFKGVAEAATGNAVK